MLMGRVVGTVVATHKDEKLGGSKLLIVEPLDLRTAQTKGSPVVAVDAVGAGEGEIVLCVSGSSARLTDSTKDRPVDTVIAAIVDHYDMEGEIRYRKHDAT